MSLRQQHMSMIWECCLGLDLARPAYESEVLSRFWGSLRTVDVAGILDCAGLCWPVLYNELLFLSSKMRNKLV